MPCSVILVSSISHSVFAWNQDKSIFLPPVLKRTSCVYRIVEVHFPYNLILFIDDGPAVKEEGRLSFDIIFHLYEQVKVCLVPQDSEPFGQIGSISDFTDNYVSGSISLNFRPTLINVPVNDRDDYRPFAGQGKVSELGPILIQVSISPAPGNLGLAALGIIVYGADVQAQYHIFIRLAGQSKGFPRESDFKYIPCRRGIPLGELHSIHNDIVAFDFPRSPYEAVLTADCPKVDEELNAIIQERIDEARHKAE